jgi:UDP-glucose 4-epimerase
MNLSSKRCLVTGGAGFIGSHLVDHLIEHGCHVRVLDNLSNGNIDNIAHHTGHAGFEFLKGSVTDPLDVAQVMRGIEVVFHLACLGVRHSLMHPFENHRVNTEGTLFLLEEARRAKVERFIHCSSSEIYGTAREEVMRETHPARPCTIYGASKLAGEAYARAYFTTYGFPACIIRPFNTFGPRSHHDGDAGEMVPKSIVRLLSGKKIVIFGDGSQSRDFTYVTDTVRALRLAAESERVVGQTLNVGAGFDISIKKLAERIIEETIGTPPEKHIQYLQKRPGDVSRLCADASLFKSYTGWEPHVSLSEGLHHTIDYFRHHPDGIEALSTAETGCNWSLDIP